MKYQKIDQSKEINRLRAEKAGEAKFAAWLATLDRDQYRQLAQDHPARAKELQALVADAKERITFQDHRRRELTKLGAPDPDISVAQRRWLDKRTTELEREHARLEEMSEHANVYGEDRTKLAWDISVVEAGLSVCHHAAKSIKATKETASKSKPSKAA